MKRVREKGERESERVREKGERVSERDGKRQRRREREKGGGIELGEGEIWSLSPGH